MEEVGITVNEEGAAKAGEDYALRCLQPQSSECPLLVTIKTEPEATFNRKLKRLFLTTLTFCLLCDIALSRDYRLNSGSIYYLSWLFVHIVTDWQTSIMIVIIAGFVFVGAFLRKLKKTSGSAPAREVRVQISAAVQQV